MIPKKLILSGFLSYRERTEIDFNGLHLACITGHNGAGKSSLLDAITWALFGKARTRGTEIITIGETAAEVSYTFEYEHNTYRVIRRLEEGKGSSLEFQVLRPDDSWRPLSERSIRATESRIQQILRLDYDTFVNAAFFLQGQADSFTQKTPAERKEILSKILGLEIWETWRQRAVERRRQMEERRNQIDASLDEIEAELAEEPQRIAELQRLQTQLESLQTRQQNLVIRLEQARAQHTQADACRQEVERLEQELAQTEQEQENRRTQYAELGRRAAKLEELTAHAEEVRQAHKKLQTLRQQLREMEAAAGRFQELEAQRAELEKQIAIARTRLESERTNLLQQQSQAETAAKELQNLQQKQEQLHTEQQRLEAESARIAENRQQVQGLSESYQQKLAELKAIKQKTAEIKDEIETLARIESAVCPTCGQPLTADHKAARIAELEQQGKEQGEQYRQLQAEATQQYETIKQINAAITAWEQQGQRQLERVRQEIVRIETERASLQEVLTRWQEEGQPRLQALQTELQAETFAAEISQQLAAVLQAQAKLGYNPQAHAALQQEIATLEETEGHFTEMAKAEASLAELKERIQQMQEETARADLRLDELRTALEAKRAEMSQLTTALPDLKQIENEQRALQIQVNNLQREIGMAEQRVRVLDQARQRRTALQEERETVSRTIARYQQLEKAFGKNGAPALIIEQALPQIEEHANDILARLSDGQMTLRFKTQQAYKDTRRSDLKETLEIEISDPAGIRSYEMFSGGESFRINFAIRLALSKVLAQRKDARLQMLVIDEGFGSQDAQGKQRLIEAINAIQNEFALILIITHLEELKEAFPNRIEVYKSENGSVVQVL